MKRVARAVWILFSSLRLVPHIILMKYHSSSECISLDLERWAKEIFKKKPESIYGEILVFVKLMTYLSEYRNLFYYRVGWLCKILYPLCRPKPLLNINKVDEGIGPGFFILHGNSTIVSARKIGINCMVLQGVTIGYTDKDKKPVIGDNVIVYAGAKVLGDITIGDNVKIGANSVVIKDVPENSTVVGVYPAYIVLRNGERVKELL